MLNEAPMHQVEEKLNRRCLPSSQGSSQPIRFNCQLLSNITGQHWPRAKSLFTLFDLNRIECPNELERGRTEIIEKGKKELRIM